MTTYTFTSSLDSGLTDNTHAHNTTDFSGNTFKETPSGDAHSDYGSIDTVATDIDITGDEVSVDQIALYDATSAAWLGGTELELTDGTDGVRWVHESNWAAAQYNNGSGWVTVAESYGEAVTNFQKVRIREASGTIYWDKHNGTSWSNHASSSTPTIDVTNVQVKLIVGSYDSGSPNPAYSELDNLITPEVAAGGILLPMMMHHGG